MSTCYHSIIYDFNYRYNTAPLVFAQQCLHSGWVSWQFQVESFQLLLLLQVSRNRTSLSQVLESHGEETWISWEAMISHTPANTNIDPRLLLHWKYHKISRIRNPSSPYHHQEWNLRKDATPLPWLSLLSLTSCSFPSGIAISCLFSVCRNSSRDLFFFFFGWTSDSSSVTWVTDFMTQKKMNHCLWKRDCSQCKLGLQLVDLCPPWKLYT